MFVILKTITLLKFIVTHCYLSPLFLVLVHQCRKIKWNYYAVNNHCCHQHYCNTMTMNYWGKLFFSVVAFDKKDGPLTPEEEEQRCTTKRKVLGNIRFIGKTYYLIDAKLTSSEFAQCPYQQSKHQFPSWSINCGFSTLFSYTVGTFRTHWTHSEHIFLLLWVRSEHIARISEISAAIILSSISLQNKQIKKNVLWLLSCLVLGELAKYDMLHEAIVHRCIKQVNSCMNENGKSSLQITFSYKPVICQARDKVWPDMQPVWSDITQRCIQVFKLWGPLDPFLKNLGVHCKVLGVQLIYRQQD